MTDFFALLGLSPQVLPDEVVLKEAYFRRAAALHPDASHGDAKKFADLQEAHRIVGDHGLRLKHLLALRFPDYQPPSGIVGHSDIFMLVGQAIQNAKMFSQRQAAATSPLARALLAEEQNTTEQGIRTALRSLQECRSEFFKKLTALHDKGPQVTPEELAALASEWAFFSRWHSELAEWEFRLKHG